MEREFVPYELALKLKALGFDEPCFSFYMGGFEELGRIKYVNPSNVDGTNVLAPTFSQAFRWFREKYGLQHDITLSVDNNNQLVGFYIVIHKLDPLWNEDQSIDFEIYTTDRDKAELACIEKLIELAIKSE